MQPEYEDLEHRVAELENRTSWPRALVACVDLFSKALFGSENFWFAVVAVTLISGVVAIVKFNVDAPDVTDPYDLKCANACGKRSFDFNSCPHWNICNCIAPDGTVNIWKEKTKN